MEFASQTDFFAKSAGGLGERPLKLKEFSEVCSVFKEYYFK
jgi:hypothetical protein